MAATEESMIMDGCKNLLMICYYYPPMYAGGVERSAKLAEHLPEHGWKPVVVTTNAHGTGGGVGGERVVRTTELLNLYRWLFNEEFRKTKKAKEDAAVISATTPGSGMRKVAAGAVLKWLFIPDIQLGWGAFALRPALRMLKSGEADVIYTTSAPESSQVFGLILKRLTGKPWVMDLRDPWTFEPVRDAARESRLRLSVERAMERMCFRHADAIVINTPEATRRYKAMYPAFGSKMRAITNGFDAGELARAKAGLERPFPWRDPGEGVSVISHTGNFVRHGDGDRTPYVLLDAIKELLEEGVLSAESHRVVFAGDLHAETLEHISRLGLDGLIEAPGIIAHFDAMRLMFRSDLLLLFDPLEDGRTYVRSKLYEYLGSGKPILGIAPDGASRELLARSGRGLLAHPDDPDGVREAMKAMVQKQAAPNPAPDFDLASYERKRIAGDLASLLDGLVE